MNQWILLTVLTLAAYLLGSIPTAVWVGRLFFGIDVREHGSGNAGATNTMRVLGVKAGIPVIIVDILKGWAAVSLITFQSYWVKGSEIYISFQIFLSAAAIIGHILPVFAGFRGGKGVATLFGSVLAIHPLSTFVAIGIFLLVLIISKYVSLGSIIAGLSFPFITIFIFRSHTITMTVFSIAVAVLLVITHRGNIKRLIRGTESKATFLFGDKKEKK